MPTISVIVPVYKVEPYLHRCVDSILAQTFTDFELILVDDGSPDNCGAICDEYAAQDSRVHVIHQPNGGLSAARNAGLDWAFANSDSEWLSFIDSDDWVHEEYLERLYRACVDTSVDISSVGLFETDGNVHYNYSADEFSLRTISTEEVYFRSVPYYQLPTISSCTKLFRKELWRDIRFPAGKVNEDRFTTHLILFQTARITYLTAPLYYYLVREDSIMHSQWMPKRLDDLEAIKGQIAFFDKKGLLKIRDYSISGYVKMLCDFYNSSASYLDIHRELKQELFQALKKYRRDLSLREKIKARIAIHPKLNFIFVFHGNVVNNGLLFALKALGKHI